MGLGRHVAHACSSPVRDQDTMVKNIKRFMRDTKDAAQAVDVAAATGTGEYTYKDG